MGFYVPEDNKESGESSLCWFMEEKMLGTIVERSASAETIWNQLKQWVSLG